MLIINVKDNESIDKALKRFKKKFEKTGVLRQFAVADGFPETVSKASHGGYQGHIQRTYVRQSHRAIAIAGGVQLALSR